MGEGKRSAVNGGSNGTSKAEEAPIGIGGAVARPLLPHHRAYGSVHGGSAGKAKNRRSVGAGRACQRRQWAGLGRSSGRD
jgi:hypothetical protein